MIPEMRLSNICNKDRERKQTTLQWTFTVLDGSTEIMTFPGNLI